MESNTPILAGTLVNIYYLTGQVFAGYVYLPAGGGEPISFVQRPAEVNVKNAIRIRKPEAIPALLEERGINVPKTLALEVDALTYNEIERLRKAFNLESVENASTLLRQKRMIKRPDEIEEMRRSAKTHMEVYSEIPNLFKKGMRDIDLQIEIERLMRKKGSIGIFRTFGSNMDVFMGTVLAGSNAEEPSPFDFSLGGKGMHPILPLGVSGAEIKPGTTVSVDMSGNYTAYISDMTRTFSLGELPDLAYQVHEVSVNMHRYLRETAKPGTPCADIYTRAVEMAEEAGFAQYFMGTKQQAKFVGHGTGLEINELPVLMGRSKDLLQPGMIIAFEPKLVIPGIGAVGIENTYLVTETGVENLTPFREDIIPL